MTDERASAEGAEEAIEDLEAPAEAQKDVAGGVCPQPSAMSCWPYPPKGGKPTCNASEADCTRQSGVIVVNEQ